MCKTIIDALSIKVMGFLVKTIINIRRSSIRVHKIYRRNIERQSHVESIQNPEKFWSNVSKSIDWYQPCDKVLDASNPPFYRWFKGIEELLLI